MRSIRELIADVQTEMRESGSPADALAADSIAESAEFSKGVFFGLQLKSHVYGGTVPPEVVEQRRAKNRHARRARAGNTRAIARQARLNTTRNRLRRFARGQAPDPLGLHEAEAES